ncbi:MAG: serine hydrolase [Holophagaceae bacterium]|nr:serine hydrolase [Holophagaceae bacterium]
MPRSLLPLLVALGLACGGGSTGGGPSGGGPAADPWSSVTAAIQGAQSQFPGAPAMANLPAAPAGLTVEVLTTDGVVYSKTFGAFGNQTYTAVASASKMVSGTVLLQLVDKGVLSLDTKAKDILKDRDGQPWSGNMGEIRLRHLLSFTSGINSEVLSSESATITLDEAVTRIYEDQRSVATAPGSTFYYGSTHLRIAARMAEVATGKSWRQLFDENLRVPLGWSSLSTYGGGANPNPAGSLACTGLEYTRFLMMQLRKGLDGSARLMSEDLANQRRLDAFGPATTIAYTPYALLQRTNHYGFGNWVETQNGAAPSTANPIQRVSSTGKFGWAPWIEVGNGQNWAAIIMCQQPDAALSFLPSENLKLQLAPLIQAAVTQHPPVVRTVP